MHIQKAKSNKRKRKKRSEDPLCIPADYRFSTPWQFNPLWDGILFFSLSLSPYLDVCMCVCVCVKVFNLRKWLNSVRLWFVCTRWKKQTTYSNGEYWKLSVFYQSILTTTTDERRRRKKLNGNKTGNFNVCNNRNNGNSKLMLKFNQKEEKKNWFRCILSNKIDTMKWLCMVVFFAPSSSFLFFTIDFSICVDINAHLMAQYQTQFR